MLPLAEVRARCHNIVGKQPRLLLTCKQTHSRHIFQRPPYTKLANLSVFERCLKDPTVME